MRIEKFQRHFLALLSLFVVTTSLLTVRVAEAVPAFARQTGMACMSCHFQSFPALNAFGRAFRASGYTMRGVQPMIEGEDLSLPNTLNVSVITKLRYQLKGDVDGGRGEVQWPDEAALLVGGRAAENIGFLMELGLGPVGADADTGTGTITGDTNGNGIMDPGETWVADTGTGEGETHGTFLSTKFQFNLNDKFAIIPFSTDGLGAGYGFELMNTGAQRSQRPIENRKGFSAGQLLGTASGEASGIAFAFHTNDLYINYSHWTPTWGNTNANIFGGLAHYVRAAYMPTIGGWDTGIGISAMTGKIKSGETDPADETYVDGWTIDGQAQGEVGGMPLGLYASYGVAPKSTSSEENHYNSSTTDDERAWGVLGKLGVMPGKAQLYLAYSLLDKDAENTGQTTVGAQYLPAQNVKFELYNVSSDSDDDGDDYTMLMLFAGF